MPTLAFGRQNTMFNATLAWEKDNTRASSVRKYWTRQWIPQGSVSVEQKLKRVKALSKAQELTKVLQAKLVKNPKWIHVPTLVNLQKNLRRAIHATNTPLDACLSLAGLQEVTNKKWSYADEQEVDSDEYQSDEEMDEDEDADEEEDGEPSDEEEEEDDAAPSDDEDEAVSSGEESEESEKEDTKQDDVVPEEAAPKTTQRAARQCPKTPTKKTPVKKTAGAVQKPQIKKTAVRTHKLMSYVR